MEKLNEFQKEFMEMLAEIQDTCVQIALCQQNDCLEDILYDVTANVIIAIMESIDGYGNLDFICKNQALKKNPFIELHDVVCEYVKMQK